MTKEIIHLVLYADQPNIQILCTGEWSEPAWAPKECIIREQTKTSAGIYRADNDQLYTFSETEVSCPDCIIRRSQCS